MRLAFLVFSVALGDLIVGSLNLESFLFLFFFGDFELTQFSSRESNVLFPNPKGSTVTSLESFLIVTTGEVSLVYTSYTEPDYLVFKPFLHSFYSLPNLNDIYWAP